VALIAEATEQSPPPWHGERDDRQETYFPIPPFFFLHTTRCYHNTTTPLYLLQNVVTTLVLQCYFCSALFPLFPLQLHSISPLRICRVASAILSTSYPALASDEVRNIHDFDLRLASSTWPCLHSSSARRSKPLRAKSALSNTLAQFTSQRAIGSD
jgi:hypothetical protein